VEAGYHDGPDLAAPTAVAVFSWGNDPCGGGTYSHIRPGGSAADADLLAAPVLKRLCFAGEHTQSARLADADGAFCSGIREAKRLLRSPTLPLQCALPTQIRSALAAKIIVPRPGSRTHAAARRVAGRCFSLAPASRPSALTSAGSQRSG
jgi:hypothetical protein